MRFARKSSNWDFRQKSHTTSTLALQAAVIADVFLMIRKKDTRLILASVFFLHRSFASAFNHYFAVFLNRNNGVWPL
jgi:hypothetical protein